MNSGFTIENLFAPLYLSTAICYGAYNYKIKFRFKQNYKKIEERVIFSLLFILSILLICSELMYLYYIQEYNHLKKLILPT